MTKQISDGTKKWHKITLEIQTTIITGEWGWLNTCNKVKQLEPYNGDPIMILVAPKKDLQRFIPISAAIYDKGFVIPAKSSENSDLIELVVDKTGPIGLRHPHKIYVYCLAGQIKVLFSQDAKNFTEYVRINPLRSFEIEAGQYYRLEPDNNTVMIWAHQKIQF